MAYDDQLADRVRRVLQQQHVAFHEKRMFGGLCFMVDGKMCIGIESERLMARVGPEAYKAALQRPGCTEMDFTGRPLKGFVFVDSQVLDADRQLAYWVKLCLEFNPKAPVSKPRKKK